MRAKKKQRSKKPLLFVYGGILHLGTIMRAVEKRNVTVFTVGGIFLTLEFACDILDIKNYRRLKTMAVFKNNKRGTWTCKFYYTDWTGKRKQKKKEGFRTKKEAQAFEADFLNSCKTDVDITFSNLVNAYMEDCKVRLKPTTYNHKEHIIRTKLLPYFGNLPLNAIDVAIVRKWQNEIIASDKNYSPTYQKSIHNQLSAILNYAVKYYGLTSNAAAKCGSIGRKNADKMDFWTVAEFQQFIKSVTDDTTAKTIFYLFFYSGIREGELLALTLNDFNFEDNTVSINKTYVRLDGKDIIQEPKTKKSKRIVSLPKQIMEMILDYSKQLYEYQPTERLFCVTKNYLLRKMEKYCKLSGVKKIRIHDLRHSYASMLIELGVPPLEIQERLGHEDIQTTLNTYSHLYPNKHYETTEKLEKLIT